MKQLNLDQICEDIYKCLPSNRENFNKLMKDINRKILFEDDDPSIRKKIIKIKTQADFAQSRNSQKFSRNLTTPSFGNIQSLSTNFTNNCGFNYNTNFNDFNKYSTTSQDFRHQNLNQNLNQDFNPNFNQGYLFPNNDPNMNINLQNNQTKCMTTIPEGEMLNLKPLQNKMMHKNYTDVHANSKFYYPEEYENKSDIMKDMQWTDRANNINLMYNPPANSNTMFQGEQMMNEPYGLNNNFSLDPKGPLCNDFNNGMNLNSSPLRNYDMNFINQNQNDFKPELRINRNMLMNSMNNY